MGFGSAIGVLFMLGILSGMLALYLCPDLVSDREPPKLADEYWGRGTVPEDAKFPKDNPAVNKYTIHIDDSILNDLKSRLNNTRYTEPLDNVQFQYGFRATYLKEIVDHWRTKYDWRKHEKELNKFNHFKTQIEGIKVHFIHQKPDVKGKKLRVLPLLLTHGWPGSVVEFQKILPLLTTAREGRDYVFEVICPSIPGYGFSEAPHQPGFSVASAARMFVKLMERLGHTRFYVQGGDYGSVISGVLSKAYPERVIGAHFNMLPDVRLGLIASVKYAAGYFLPTMFMSKKEYERFYPPSKKFYGILEETGYFHLQATKPDTVGSVLSDTPAGLAAYILEKFSTGTELSNRELADGGLTKKFTLDELLTNVMVYWSTNSMASSQRLYKEIHSEKFRSYGFDKVPLKVPSGMANFPNEGLAWPRFLAEHQMRNLVRYTDMPRGGHFAAFEEPELLADEIWDFILDVEKMLKEQRQKK